MVFTGWSLDLSAIEEDAEVQALYAPDEQAFASAMQLYSGAMDSEGKFAALTHLAELVAHWDGETTQELQKPYTDAVAEWNARSRSGEADLYAALGLPQ